MNQLQLDTDEVILFEKEKVKRESNKSYFGDFVLTNKKIIFIQKGIFGGIKKIDEYKQNLEKIVEIIIQLLICFLPMELV